MATAIEAIYRDLEYARSLIKGGRDDLIDAEHATIRERHTSPRPSPERSGTHSARSSTCSTRGAPSEWSVISDQEDVPDWPLSQLEKPRVDWMLEDGQYTVFGDTWFVSMRL